jgi:phosphoglycerate kinase
MKMKFLSDLLAMKSVMIGAGGISRILMRVDLNIPKNNDLSRIYAIRATLFSLINAGVSVILLSHYGRPGTADSFSDAFSLKPISRLLSGTLGLDVEFVPNNILQELPAIESKVSLLENLRFYEEEEKNGVALAKKLASLGDAFVNEAFSVSHRKHCSVDAITEFLPSFAGLSFEKELNELTKVAENVTGRYTVILGGSKVSSKIDVLRVLSKKANTLIVGGAMANTFLSASGKNLGKSVVEKELFEEAREIMKDSSAEIILPIDFLASRDIEVFGSSFSLDDILPEFSCFDIGPQTIEKIKKVVNESDILLWNGALGAFEYANFGESSLIVSEAIVDATQRNGLISIVGGGETIASMGDLKTKVTYFSTAGGAFLDFVSGKQLPGVSALRRRPC